eukprot:9432566-Ditylum_brightwellii.AAC.1
MNGNPTQPLNEDEFLDILEYGVPASWRREFTVQGFDPVDHGLKKFVDFCTRLESCEPSEGEAKGEKPSKAKTAGKRKAEVSTMPTSSAGKKKKFYCEMHGRNNTHDTDNCFELNRRKKRAKLESSRSGKDKVSCKDLNAFVKAKVTAALNKAKKKQKKEKE